MKKAELYNIIKEAVESELEGEVSSRGFLGRMVDIVSDVINRGLAPSEEHRQAMETLRRVNPELYEKVLSDLSNLWVSNPMSGLEETLYRLDPNALLDEMMSEETEDDGEEKDWIEKAVDPEHEGDCTPMTKSTCTPARKALAKRFKKAARKKKKEGGSGWQGKV